MKIIAYIGVIGSGKDYQANEMKKHLESKDRTVKTIKFADALREMIWLLIGWTPKTEEEYEKFKKSTFSFFGGEFSGREILIRLGTDIMRNYDKNVWVNKMMLKINSSTEDYILITDCRFTNEVNCLIDCGAKFIFCNYKSERYELKNHSSEAFAQKCIPFFKDCEIMENESIKTILNTI